jgi:hypothetical protein
MINQILGQIAGASFSSKLKNHAGKEVVDKIYGYKKEGRFQFYLQPTQSATSCTILARSVDSMSEEEFEEYEYLCEGHYYEPIKNGTITISNINDFMYLVSIGVLPKYIADILTENGIKIEWINK